MTTKLSSEIGYQNGLPGNPMAYWKATPAATSGRSYPNLQKADLEKLAVQWLENGAGDSYWEYKPRAKRQTWKNDRAKITANVTAIFVKQWQKWKQNTKATSTPRKPRDPEATSTTNSNPLNSPTIKTESRVQSDQPKTATTTVREAQSSITNSTYAPFGAKEGSPSPTKKRRLETPDDHSDGFSREDAKDAKITKWVVAKENFVTVSAAELEALQAEVDSLRAQNQLLQDEVAQLRNERDSALFNDTGFHTPLGDIEEGI